MNNSITRFNKLALADSDSRLSNHSATYSTRLLVAKAASAQTLQAIQEYIADSRIEIESARLVTLLTAWKMDQIGHLGARTEIAMAKVKYARVLFNVIDRALQVHGSLGYSCDMPLEKMYRSARMAPLVDGADEVHKVSIAKQVLKNHDAVEGWPSEHIPSRREAALKRFAQRLQTNE